MPIYEYECTECSHHTEVLQKVSASPLKKCEKCGGKVERLISSPAIQFKGTGWYVTDYARRPDDSSESRSDTSDRSSKEDSTSKKSRSKDSGPAVSASSTSKS